MTAYIDTIEFRISGIPCLIGITHYHSQKPMGKYADSDWDCYGYTDCEWEVLDRKGYKAAWLVKKMTARDEDAIIEAINKHFN